MSFFWVQALSMVRTAWMTVLWSRPPKWADLFQRKPRVSAGQEHTDLRGKAMLLWRFLPWRSVALTA